VLKTRISSLLTPLADPKRPIRIEANVNKRLKSSLTVAISQFCQREKIKRTRSSPHHSQSIGKSESAVKIVKTALRKSGKTALNSYKTLLDQRNTPTVGMTTSPSERFLNCETKTEIPMKATLLKPELTEHVLEEKAKKTKKSRVYYGRNAKGLNELSTGDTVRIKPDGLAKGQEWRRGSVVKSYGHRSYDVKEKMAKCSEEIVFT